MAGLESRRTAVSLGFLEETKQMFRTKKSLFMVMTSGMLLQFGGCGGGFGELWRQTLINIPVGFGRAIGAALEPTTGLGNILGGLDLTTLIPGLTG